MRPLYRFAIAGAAIALLAIPGVAQAQIGPGPFAAFPTEVEDDARFLAFACSSLATLEEPVSISLTVPADATQFDLSFFDGETGRPDASGKPHWDLGGRQLTYTLYADPLLSADRSVLVGQWFGNDPNPLTGPLWTASAAQMPDNDWWGVTVQTDASAKAPSGRYFYNLVIDLEGVCNPGENTESSVKIAASAPMSFLVPQFGLVAAMRQLFNDGPILYPGGSFPPTSWITGPTTYDGTFSFFFSVGPGADELRVFDGDFDHGANGLVGNPSGTILAPCSDLDDGDTPADYADLPFFADNAVPEGAVASNVPPDDNFWDAFRRGEPGAAGALGCVRYEVIDPNGVVYRNDNPSGDREWEQFRIATQLATNPNAADYGPAVAADGSTFVTGEYLPAGSWTLRIVGLDLANLNLLSLATCSNQLDPATGETIPACLTPTVYLAGDTVWYDDDEDGVQDAGEAGISGVVLNLYDDSGSGIPLATTTTGDSSDPNWTECVANNTGLDTDGLYCFGVDEPGVYMVGIDASNFGPGGVLEGLTSTTGGEQLTFEVIDDNVLTYDYGYVAPPPLPAVIGDTVWLDSDEDGAQDAGEAGIAGVTVELVDVDGNVLATAVTGDGSDPNWATCQAANTGLDEAGLYCFVVATGFDYTVRVAASSFDSGGPLEGLASTIGTDEISEFVGDGDVLTYDLPYAPVGGGGCPPVIDWEKDGQGNGLSRGTIVTGQFAALGFQVISHSPQHHPAMIFDSSYPTGGDKDLGTPNQDFGGPGRGNGGDAGSTYENRDAHGNVLILSEDGHHWDPDDDAGGGWVYFVFDSPVTVDWVQLLDIEESGGKIKTYGASGSQIGQISIPVLGDNGFVQLPVNQSGVTKLKVWLKGSGAVPAFSFCPDGGEPPPPSAPGTGTIGYWKNHPEAWPVDEVVIGGRTYTKAEAIHWMKKPSHGDKSIDLFKQLVAAVLNVEIGNESSCIADTVGHAQAFMSYVPVGSGLPSWHWAWRYYGAPLHEKLDDYNNGRLCAPHRG